jgi:ankyrin repeat protein
MHPDAPGRRGRRALRTATGLAAGAACVLAWLWGYATIMHWRDPPWIETVEEGTCQDLQDLLSRGASPDSRGRDGRTWLHAVVGDPAKVGLLLAHGADPKAADGSGRTPLHLAAAGGHAETCTLLLTAGADPGALDDCGRTPLDIARGQGNVAVTRSLHSPTPRPR